METNNNQINSFYDPLIGPTPNNNDKIYTTSGHLVDSRILEPYYYLLNTPGKDMRNLLIDCFNKWLNINNDEINIIKSIIGSLHSASLLIDDIEDNSKLRRGKPVSHSIYGIANTLNCANYVYFLALERCEGLKSKAAMSIFVNEMLALHRGQGQDILWREQSICPTEEQYMTMVQDKTGGLFRLAVGLMQCFSIDNHTNYNSLLNLLALYFQIRDDYINLSSSQYQQSKSFCEDLTEGKYSFPIIHALTIRPLDTRLTAILRQRTEDINVKKHAVEWLISCGSLDYTKTKLNELKDQLINEINQLGGHETLCSLINDLHNTINDDFQNI